MINITSYNEKKNLEAMTQIFNTLNFGNIRALKESSHSLLHMSLKISDFNKQLESNKDKLLKTWLDEKILEEQQEYNMISDATLNSTFDELQNLMYFTRTSDKKYMIAEKTKQITKVKADMMLQTADKQLQETYNFKTNVTVCYSIYNSYLYVYVYTFFCHYFSLSLSIHIIRFSLSDDIKF
jgi:hypothetical protein